jgi:hypothetical protein
MTDFIEFPKIPRLFRDMVITEKIDGTNGCIAWDEGQTVMRVGSRTRWITPEGDNHGFARWAYANEATLRLLGPGVHYGEWWGQGIQRNYGLTEKRFSLFNVSRWGDDTMRPTCCSVVPVLWRGLLDTQVVSQVLSELQASGSQAAPGFMRPEGVVVFHVAGNCLFKVTAEKDEKHKGEL